MSDQEKFNDAIDKIITHNRLSHAYLIETNGVSDYRKYIIDFIKKILKIYAKDIDDYKNVCLQIDNKEFINLKAVESSSWIKKEDLLNLKREYSKKSYLNYPEIYIIDDASNLTSATANSLLKFLEEPEEGIIAVLVTKNRYNIIETVRSRTQVLELTYNESFILSAETEEFINLIEDQKSIVKYDKILEIIPDKQKATELLKQLESYYNQKINESYFEKYIKYVLIIEEALNRLNYNVNYKLWVDALLVKMMEVEK